MSALDKLNRLADKFAFKIQRFAEEPVIGEDLQSVFMNAFSKNEKNNVLNTVNNADGVDLQNSFGLDLVYNGKNILIKCYVDGKENPTAEKIAEGLMRSKINDGAKGKTFIAGDTYKNLIKYPS